jgi:hypothetical protein
LKAFPNTLFANNNLRGRRLSALNLKDFGDNSISVIGRHNIMIQQDHFTNDLRFFQFLIGDHSGIDTFCSFRISGRTVGGQPSAPTGIPPEGHSLFF